MIGSGAEDEEAEVDKDEVAEVEEEEAGRPLFLREPPPTGMLRREPPSVQ